MEKKLDLTVIIPWLLSLVTVAIGIWQFSEQQGQRNREPFLQKQLETSFLASETAARLATETDPVEWEKARQTFWRLYWGPLGIVEDQKVAGAMYDLGRLVPDKPVSAPTLPMKALEQPSLRLAHAARNLILASWNVDLPPLEGMQR
jgi:hypothetical protein